ncbi:MAG: GGDEF domain-containing protein [Pseudomonadota bacterium]
MVDRCSENKNLADIETAWQLRESAPHTALRTINDIRIRVPNQSLNHARLLIVEAACHWRQFQFVDMMNRLFEAFELLKTSKDYLWLARLQGRISVGLTSIGDMAGAYRHLHLQLGAASRCSRGQPRDDELFTVFHNMGRHFFVREDYERADRCYQKCYDYLCDDDVTNVLLLQNHAETLARLGWLERASDELEKALTLSKQHPPNRSVVYALGVKAWILTAQKRTAEAENTLLSAVAYATKNNIPSAQLRMKLATLHLAQNKVNSAQGDLQPVDSIITDQGDKHDRAHYHDLMSQVLEASGDHEAALSHYKIFHRTEQEIRTSQTNTRFQAEKLIDRLETIRRQSTRLRRENLALKDTVNRYKSLHEKARELSERDSLTGLYNRRMLELKAENIIKLTANSSTSVAVAVIDLDHFKRINDTFGHHIGDQVLAAFASLITTTFRSADCIARYGGEEFVLVMPQANDENAKDALVRLRDLTTQYPWPTTDHGLTVTFSAGIATTNQAESFDTLFQKADKALYYAKAMGRNRICVDGEYIDFNESEFVPDIDLADLNDAYG